MQTFNRLTRRGLVLGGLGLVLTTAGARAQAEAPLPIVASFSILADITRQVGGARVAVTSIVGPNQDAHVFQPSPADARKLAAARLVIVNGLGFDAFMDRLVKASGAKLTPVVASAAITPLKAGAEKGHKGHDHGHASSASDPHAWQSVANAKAYARSIAAALTAVDPAGKTAYDANLAAYLAKLDALDADIRAAVATIPADRRAVATTHDAFGYFAADYGVRFLALQGISSDAEPSAADLARIIRQVKSLKAPAVFLENVIDPRKAERIARETGAKIGGTLYSDSLSVENGPATTYIDLMRHNARQLTEALKP